MKEHLSFLYSEHHTPPQAGVAAAKETVPPHPPRPLPAAQAVRFADHQGLISKMSSEIKHGIDLVPPIMEEQHESSLHRR